MILPKNETAENTDAGEKIAELQAELATEFNEFLKNAQPDDLADIEAIAAKQAQLAAEFDEFLKSQKK